MSGPVRLLEVSDLAVTRGGVQVLEIPSFALERGEIVALIGPNGAGKSTLLLALAQLVPTTGTLRYHGEMIDSARSVQNYRRQLTMVFQQPLLFATTVYANVAAGLKFRRLEQEEIKARVMETLALFNIEHLAQRSAGKLSGGEAQRTALARAFAVRPEIIMLDEPFVALDPPMRQGLLDDLARILADTSTTALVATHDQMEALQLADRMVVLNEGKIVQSGVPSEVINRPCDEFVANFVGMENIMTGRVASAYEGMLDLEMAKARISVPGKGGVDDQAVFCIRPEYVTVDTFDPSGETSARNVFPATISKILPVGVMQKLQLDCGFPLVAYLTRQSLDNLHLCEGKRVFASFKASAVHLIRVSR